MRCDMDFSQSPAQRRRTRERNFYRVLVFFLLLGIALAAFPGWRVSLHTASLEKANVLLTGELHTLAPQARQTAELRSQIAALEKQITAHQQLGKRRQQSAQLLRAAAQAAQASAGKIRLHRLLLQGDRGELRGQAASAQEVRDFTAALGAAGLEGATLHDLHVEDGAYAFILAIPLPALQTGTSPAPAPATAVKVAAP